MAKSPISDADILRQIPAARARAERARRTRPHAESASYNRRTRTVHVQLTNGGAFSIPVALIPELANASDAALRDITVAPAGIALHWERLDADFSVEGLVRLVLGVRTLMKAAGAAGGQSRSRAKVEAARVNGKNGGRPRTKAS